MKELSDEELVEKYNDNIYDDSIKAELLSRLKRGRAAEELVENLKCCGNCRLFDGLHSCTLDKDQYIFTSNDLYCPNWQSDGLTRKERE